MWCPIAGGGKRNALSRSQPYVVRSPKAPPRMHLQKRRRPGSSPSSLASPHCRLLLQDQRIDGPRTMRRGEPTHQSRDVGQSKETVLEPSELLRPGRRPNYSLHAGKLLGCGVPRAVGALD